MREILFRGKRIDNGDLIEGFYNEVRHHNDNSHIHPFIMIPEKCVDNQQNLDFWAEVAPETVGQFTGLTDKKEKRIFEGDVCRVTRPCVLAYGKITFQNGCFWFVDDGPGGMLRLCDIKMNGFEIEVIGNIHDNPKLLEVTDNA